MVSAAMTRRSSPRIGYPMSVMPSVRALGFISYPCSRTRARIALSWAVGFFIGRGNDIRIAVSSSGGVKASSTWPEQLVRRSTSAPRRIAKPALERTDGFLPLDHEPMAAGPDDQMAGLAGCSGQVMHRRSCCNRQVFRLCPAMRELQQAIGDPEPIVFRILVQPSVPLHHDDHAKDFVQRSTQSRGNFRNRESRRFVRQELDDLDAFLERGGCVVPFAGMRCFVCLRAAHWLKRVPSGRPGIEASIRLRRIPAACGFRAPAYGGLGRCFIGMSRIANLINSIIAVRAASASFAAMAS